MYNIVSLSIGEYKGVTTHKSFKTLRAAKCEFTKLVKKLKKEFIDVHEFDKYYVQCIPSNYGWNNFNDVTYRIEKF